MTSIDAINALHAALDADCQDHGLRAILADAYEEVGDPLAAEALRWMAHYKKYPEAVRMSCTCKSCIQGMWRWYSNYSSDGHCLGVFGRRNMPGYWQYPSRREAEWAVITTWKKLNDDERSYWWSHGCGCGSVKDMTHDEIHDYLEMLAASIESIMPGGPSVIASLRATANRLESRTMMSERDPDA